MTAEADRAPRSAPHGGIAGLHFLVVDDHGFQRWLVENFLRGLGARRVTTAIDGRTALEVLRTTRVDIVVSDLDMPGMDGMELIRHLGESGEEVSLIVSSSLDRAVVASVETMARAYGVRLLGAVDKPTTAARLAEVIGVHGKADGRKAERVEPFSLDEALEGLRLGQFEPYFQPKVEIRTRRLMGAEALARWRHPTRGIVPPEHFIALLETGDAIERLSDLMLRRAAAVCRVWHSAGLDAGVSVNVSPRCIEDLTLADRMLEIVRMQALEPANVVLEVTESLQPRHMGRALETFARLRMRGFGLSIDDYGTGYSSLQQLARIPFTELKIDRGFVRLAAQSAANRAMLESSLEVAVKLGITAVAEGVETQAEWDLLRELGCHQAQGYFVAPPMPAGEFLDWAGQAREK